MAARRRRPSTSVPNESTPAEPSNLQLNIRSVSVPKAKRSDTSRQTDDEVVTVSGVRGATDVLPTPYNVFTLGQIFERSNVLRQAVEVYMVNIASYGYRAVKRYEDVDIDAEERRTLLSWINDPNPDESLAGVSRKYLYDYERYGFGFLEVIRDADNRPSLVRHAKASRTRILRKSTRFITVESTILRGSRRSTIKERKRFRRYIQEQPNSKQPVYFKEFGDPRIMDWRDGKFQGVGGKGRVRKANIATELIHGKQLSDEAYGVPRWISQLPNVLGSRESEEVNLRFFEDNTVPPMMLLVSGGQITGKSFKQLDEAFASGGLGKDRQHQMMLVEAVPETAGLDDKGHVNLKLEKLTNERQNDALFSGYDKDNQAKVQSSYRLPNTLMGKSQDVTFACYDQETETLTDRGWITHDQWQEGMQIACVDPATGVAHFAEPTDGIARYEVQNVEMYSIQSAAHDMLVTPEHRMAFRYNDEYRVAPIEEMVESSRVTVRVSAPVKPDNLARMFEVPHVQPEGGPAYHDEPIAAIRMSELMTWVGYYIADGSLLDINYSIRMGASKIGKTGAFADLHDQLELRGFRVRDDDHDGYVTSAVSHKGMALWFRENCGHSSSTKRIPSIIWSGNTAEMTELFAALMFCDGSWDSRQGRTSGAYSTVSEGLASDVQRLAILLGYRATVRKDRPGEFSEKPTFRVLLSERREAILEPKKHIERVTYSGTVYCFNVPTGVFVTRRNGKVAIQGNTANVSQFIAETQIFLPERQIHDELLNYIFVNSPRGLDLQTVKIEAKGPQITNPAEIVKTLTAANVMGALTPRASIDALNEALQLSLPQYPERPSDFDDESEKRHESGYEAWMDKPIAIALRELQAAGRIREEQDTTDDSTRETQLDGDIETSNPENGDE